MLFLSNTLIIAPTRIVGIGLKENCCLMVRCQPSSSDSVRCSSLDWNRSSSSNGNLGINPLSLMDLYGPRYSLGGLEQSFRLLRKFNYLVTTAWIKRRYLSIELSPRFFQVIQPYLPMTYSVSAFVKPFLWLEIVVIKFGC